MTTYLLDIGSVRKLGSPKCAVWGHAKRMLAKFLLLLLFALLSSKSMASGLCSVKVSQVNINVPSSVKINPGSIANGSPLTDWIGLTTTSQVYLCNYPGAYIYSGQEGVVSSGAGSYTESGLTYTIYPTGVTGVGVVIAVRDPNESFTSVQQSTRKWLYTGGAQPVGIIARVRFIKTGNVASGSHAVSRRQVAALILTNTDTGNGSVQNLTSSLYLSATTLNAVAPTCNLGAGDVDRIVTLDTFQLKDVPASGSFGYKTFSITANCSNATTARFLFQGTAWSLDGYRFNNTGTATGVGVQLASTINGQSVTVQAGGNASSRTRTVSVANGTATLPMAAAYWRVGAVTPGTVSTRITVTLSYD